MSRFNVGGTAQWLYQLSQGLNQNGIENTLIVGNCPISEKEDPNLSKIQFQKLRGLGPRTSTLSTIKAFLQLRKLIRDIKPDVVNTHTSKAGVLGRLAAKSVSRDIAVVHTYHGHILSGYFNPLLVLGIRLIERLLSLFTDYFFVSGERVLKDLRNEGVLKSVKVITVWPAVPDYALADRDSSRSELGIEKDQVVIGWLGRKVPIKRIDRILDLALMFPKSTFLVAGDGANIKNTFSEKFDKYTLENVIDLGFTSPSKIWAIADICLLTSDNEAMPISPLEAALACKPVVIVDAGASAEVVLHERTGYLCSGEISVIANHLQILINDRTLRENMGKAGRAFVLDKFRPEMSIKRQIEGYEKALASRTSD
jgi:glycosyltransferase involved in cell wall biosynthesis